MFQSCFVKIKNALNLKSSNVSFVKYSTFTVYPKSENFHLDLKWWKLNKQIFLTRAILFMCAYVSEYHIIKVGYCTGFHLKCHITNSSQAKLPHYF